MSMLRRPRSVGCVERRRARLSQLGGRLGQRTPPPQQLGQAERGRQGLRRDVARARPVDDVAAGALGLLLAPQRDQRLAPAGAHPGDHRRLAAAPRRLLRLHQQAQLLAVLTVGTGVAGIDVVGHGQLGRRHLLGRWSAVGSNSRNSHSRPSRARPRSRHHSSSCTASRRPSRTRPVLTHQFSAARTSAASWSSGYVDSVTGRPSAIGLRALQGVQRPGQVPVPGNGLLAGGEPARGRRTLGSGRACGS